MTGSIINNEYIKKSKLLSDRPGEPQAFELLRSYGQKFLENNFWPSRRDDDWKYTSTHIFSSQEFIPSLMQKKPLPDNKKNWLIENKNLSLLDETLEIIFVDGIYQPSLSDQAKSESEKSIETTSGIRVIEIKKAIERGLYPIFDLSKPKNSFEALNLGFLEEGVFIDVPSKMNFEPIIKLSFFSTQNQTPTVHLPRVVIKLNTGSKITLLETYESIDQANNILFDSLPKQWTNSQVEIYLENHSQLTWSRLQNEAPDQLHTGRTHVYLNEGSELHSLLVSQGAHLHRHDLKIEVNGSNTKAHVHGISLSNDKEHRDHNTLIDFKSGHSEAEQIFKSILHGESKSIFNGKIIIEKNSQKVESSQLNQSLILSENAEANSQPQLEIYADDVRATHGATIGQLDDDQLFYFKSRGIAESKAKLMMTQGFAIDLIERFPNEKIRSLLRQKMIAKLQGFW